MNAVRSYLELCAAAGGCGAVPAAQLSRAGLERLFSEEGASYLWRPAGYGTCAGFAAGAADASGSAARGAVGGAPRRAGRRKHVVVDTLNVLHCLDLRPSPAAIRETIEKTAPTLRETFPGRLMYVVKERDSVAHGDSARELYADVARAARVYVYAVERYADETLRDRPASGIRLAAKTGAEAAGSAAPRAEVAGQAAPRAEADGAARLRHAALGRDDFFAGVLAGRWSAPVLTEDRLRDFADFRRALPRFYVDEYGPGDPPGARPDRLYVNPASETYRRLRRPATIRLGEAGLRCADPSNGGADGEDGGDGEDTVAGEDDLAKSAGPTDLAADAPAS